jgi:PAS domain S-box-containing protein
MPWINFEKGNCSDCYKCLRACPSKAIKIIDNHAEIVEDMCIVCGHCQTVCPQGIIKISSRIEQVKNAIAEGKTVVASLAPSFAGAFDFNNPRQFVTALKKLGFSHIEETAVGAEYVKKAYVEALNSGEYLNFITTSCPSANYLIEKYYEECIPYMAPYISPMLAHGKLIRHKYGMDTHIVFIGPCTAKKHEANDFQHNDIIDEVLTFEEVSKWLKSESVEMKKLDETDFDAIAYKGGAEFPVRGGILGSWEDVCKRHGYEYVQVDGVDACKCMLEAMESKALTGVCVELNMCEGACMGGPGMPEDAPNFYVREKKVKDYAKQQVSLKQEQQDAFEDIDLHKVFIPHQVSLPEPSEEEIQEILHSMGKYKKSDELNCNTCGYRTCREKAKAVAAGMSEISMCLPFVRKKAESIRNMIFGNSPNAIILMDEDMNVLEMNPRAEIIFAIDSEKAKGIPINAFIEGEHVSEIIESREEVIHQKVFIENYGIRVFMHMVYLDAEKVYMLIMSDITESEKNVKALTEMKQKSLDAAQEVIEKQMRVAQEIASLLGETTAETKLILTKLKQLAMEEAGGQ